MSEIPQEVYEAAARAYCELRYSYPTGVYVDEVGLQRQTDRDARTTAEEPAFRAAVNVAVAAGRREAAEAIRAQIVVGAWPPSLAAGAKPRATDLAEWAARIAEGDRDGTD